MTAVYGPPPRNGMGMPHLGARYTGLRAYELEEGAACAVCGRPATNAHHVPPKGMGGGSALHLHRTGWGQFTMKPALVALCGSGTTGCHGDVHAGRVRIEWAWDDPDDKERWDSGYLLAHSYEPNGPELYGLGHWEIDTEGGRYARRA